MTSYGSNGTIGVGDKKIGKGCPVFIVAEISANHNQDLAKAKQLILSACHAGADAVKLQTYTPDTITIDSNKKHFKIDSGPWKGKTLYELYDEAHTPWAWHGELFEYARNIGIECFSTPFDNSAVEFLEKLDNPVYKVASPEIVDFQLLRCVAKTGKPIIMSTGMATLTEIEEAIAILRGSGADNIVLTKCTSAYPAPPESMNLRVISDMMERFDLLVGLSDHSMGAAVPTAAVALGACVIEKHVTLSRSDVGPDSGFSMEPHEFQLMVENIRVVEKALGAVTYEPDITEVQARKYRRSLFVVKDIQLGEQFTKENVRSIRPADGLHPRHYDDVLMRVASSSISRGTPLNEEMLGEYIKPI